MNMLTIWIDTAGKRYTEIVLYQMSPDFSMGRTAKKSWFDSGKGQQIVFPKVCIPAVGPTQFEGSFLTSSPQDKNKWNSTSTPAYAFGTWTGSFIFKVELQGETTITLPSGVRVNAWS
jgi:hypothetical protein